MPRLRARRPSLPSPRIRTSRRMRARGRWRPGNATWASAGVSKTSTVRFASLSSSLQRLPESQSSGCSMSAVRRRYAAKIVSPAAFSSRDRLDVCSGSGCCGQGGHPGVSGATFASRSRSALVYVPLGSFPPPQPASVMATTNVAIPPHRDLVTARHSLQQCASDKPPAARPAARWARGTVLARGLGAVPSRRGMPAPAGATKRARVRGLERDRALMRACAPLARLGDPWLEEGRVARLRRRRLHHHQHMRR